MIIILIIIIILVHYMFQAHSVFDIDYSSKNAYVN